MAAEVVAQVADQAAGERQFIAGRQLRFAQARQVIPQALQEYAPLSSGNTASCASGQALSRS
jgi:hypothetical protein